MHTILYLHRSSVQPNIKHADNHLYINTVKCVLRQTFRRKSIERLKSKQRRSKQFNRRGDDNALFYYNRMMIVENRHFN